LSRRFTSSVADLSRLLGKKLHVERWSSYLDNGVSNLHWGVRYVIVLGFATAISMPLGLDPKSIYWLYLLLGAVTQIGWGWQKSKLASAHKQRCDDILFAPEDKDARVMKEEISAHDLLVSFNPRTFKPDLGPLNFSWLPGDRVWLEGASGSGKTTLLRTLCGIHHTYRGSIHACSEGVSYVPQIPFFFEGESVAHNLEVKSLEGERDLVDAMGLAPFFSSLPESLETILGKEGVNPSRGQRVRLAVLRELLRRPKVLVLDEPLAGLDADSARRLMSICRVWMNGGLIVVCDHRSEARVWLEPNKMLNLNKPRETPCASASL